MADTDVSLQTASNSIATPLPTAHVIFDSTGQMLLLWKVEMPI